jgi:hypothetical protein
VLETQGDLGVERAGIQARRLFSLLDGEVEHFRSVIAVVLEVFMIFGVSSRRASSMRSALADGNVIPARAAINGAMIPIENSLYGRISCSHSEKG